MLEDFETPRTVSYTNKWKEYQVDPLGAAFAPSLLGIKYIKIHYHIDQKFTKKEDTYSKIHSSIDQKDAKMEGGGLSGFCPPLSADFHTNLHYRNVDQSAPGNLCQSPFVNRPPFEKRILSTELCQQNCAS